MTDLPFSRAEFLAVFVRYNEGVWPMQIVLLAMAGGALALLALRHRDAHRAMSAVLALLWGWMALAYFLAHFWEVNPAAPLFAMVSLVGAWFFAWDGVVRARLRYRGRHPMWLALGLALIGYAFLLYPLLSTALGRGYPQAPTFGAPCPTTIFTLGVLLLLERPFPRRVFIAPLLWAPVGIFAAVHFAIYEDLGMLVAGVAGAVAALQPLGKTSAASKVAS